MGLGITQASIVSAVTDATGDDSSDAVVKIKRLINQKGVSFCNITNWAFLRSNINFSITNAGGNVYSGASYLPATFKNALAGYIQYGNDRYPIKEVSLEESQAWPDPALNTGVPSEFCVKRQTSGYWEIEFNVTPSNTYTVYLTIELQWTDLTATTDETVITKPYYDAFVHYVNMSRFLQQGDATQYQLFKVEWHNPSSPLDGILSRILRLNSSKPMAKPGVVMDEDYVLPQGQRTAYNEKT